MPEMEAGCCVSQRGGSHHLTWNHAWCYPGAPWGCPSPRPHLTARCPAAFAEPPADWCNLSELFRGHSSAAEDRRRRLGLNLQACRGTWGQKNTGVFQKQNSKHTRSVSRRCKTLQAGVPRRLPAPHLTLVVASTSHPFNLPAIYGPGHRTTSPRESTAPSCLFFLLHLICCCISLGQRLTSKLLLRLQQKPG